MKPLEIFRKIKAKNKTALGIVSILSLTTMGGVATHASFTETGSSSISATAGKLAPAGMAIENWPFMFTVDDMVTGKTYTKTLTVKNNGTIPMKYTAVLVPGTTEEGNTLAAVPTTAVIGSTTVYTGNLKSLKIPQQTVAVGASQTITLTFKPVITDAVRDLQATSAYAIPSIEFAYTN